MNPISLMADAEKLSVGQLQQAVKNGTVPAYIGIPMMQEKIKQAKQAQAPQAPAEPPIAQQVMAQASGIDQMPSNLPTQAMNDGGIVAFANGGTQSSPQIDTDDDDDYEEYQLAQEEAEHQNSMAMQEQMAASGGSRTPVNRTPPVEGGIGSIAHSSGEKIDPKDFYNNMYSTLKAKAEEMGFKNPEAIARVGAAQSALETGYGKYLAGGNNYFGIKGSGGNKQTTKEYTPERGYYTSNESFRTYGNMGDSAADYLRLMQNPRYAKVASAETPEEAISHQGKSGYATSPHYAPSLRAIHQANMAEGGITDLNGGGVARFQSTGYVQSDPDTTENPTFTNPYKNSSILGDIRGAGKYVFDPAYRAFVEEGGDKGDISLDAYRALGNDSRRIGSKYPTSLPGLPGVIPSDKQPKFLRNLEAVTGINTLPKNDALNNQVLPNSFEPNPVPRTQTGRTVSDIITDLSGPSRPRSSGLNPPPRDNTIGNRMAEYEPSIPPIPEGASGNRMAEYEPSQKPSVGNTNGGPSGAPELSETGKTPSAGVGQKERTAYDEFMDYFKKGHEDLKSQKQEDKYMAILQAGLGMMAGTSPNALANIGQGASAGVAHYGASAKQRAAEQNALLKGEMTARRYQEMGEDRRALQQINKDRYGESLDYRTTKDANDLEEKQYARTQAEQAKYAQLYPMAEAKLKASVDKSYPMGSLSPPINGVKYEDALAAIQRNPELSAIRQKAFPQLANIRDNPAYDPVTKTYK
jgi:flagellum-specific peptidoglycan hydrolase FlgJ